MPIADLRKELKELRKKAMPTPVSRMKRDDLVAELTRLRGSPAAEAPKEVPVKKEVKVVAPKKEAPKKEEEVIKKTKGVKDRGMEEPPKKKQKTESAGPRVRAVKEAAETKAKKVVEEGKAEKGSDAMKEKMARLRAMRKAKKEEA